MGIKYEVLIKTKKISDDRTNPKKYHKLQNTVVLWDTSILNVNHSIRFKHVKF